VQACRQLTWCWQTLCIQTAQQGRTTRTVLNKMLKDSQRLNFKICSLAMRPSWHSSNNQRMKWSSISMYGGYHLWGYRWNWNCQPKNRIRKLEAAEALEAEEYPSILEWLELGCWVTNGGCWTCRVWHITSQTTWLAIPRFSFPMIIPNPMLEIEAHAMMLKQLLYVLMTDIVSPWDPKTMETSSLKI